MTQLQLNQAVALATGEDPCVIAARGFSDANPAEVDFDPEPCDVEDLIVDWDADRFARNVAFFPRRRREAALA